METVCEACSSPCAPTCTGLIAQGKVPTFKADRYAVGRSYHAVQADLNGDGAIDFIVEGGEILLSNGDGTYRPGDVVQGVLGEVSEALDSIAKVSFAVFIPSYFAIVGLKLDLVRVLSWRMLATFILGSCVAKILSASLPERLAGFRGLDLVYLAITTNARGGPGIVLASVPSSGLQL